MSFVITPRHCTFLCRYIDGSLFYIYFPTKRRMLIGQQLPFNN